MTEFVPDACFLPFSVPPLSFTPAVVASPLDSSGEFLRGHGSEMTRVLMQSAAEFLEDLYRLSIAGCRRFCAQFTDAVFSRRLGITNKNPVTRTCGSGLLLFRTTERVQKIYGTKNILTHV
jgi:hypothetical protein